jgi:peptidoglycan-N-acetylglucosamine deacetylase
MVHQPDQLRGRVRALLKSTILSACSVQSRLKVKNSILLTFDDGPHPEVTPAVLDRLREHDARAVFFVVGNRIVKAPEVLPRIVSEQHFIGNHSQTHNPSLTYAPYSADVAACQRSIEAITGRRPMLFRPATGKITVSALRAARSNDLRTLLWSLDSNDWRLRDRQAAQALGVSIGRSAVGGDIVLLHDDNPNVVHLLDELLPLVRNRGFDLACAATELHNQPNEKASPQ